MHGIGSILDRIDEIHRVMVISEFQGEIGDRIRVDSDFFYTVNYFFGNVLQSCRHVSIIFFMGSP